MSDKDSIKAAADRIVALEAELESVGDASVGDENLRFAKAALTEWIETIVGVVASPGVGRVSLIHADGTQTKIASPTLPYLLSRPVSFS
jgi:hypothetical protein